MLKVSSKRKFQNMKFILIKDTEVLFHRLCLAFIIALLLCHFDQLLFIKIETNAFGFAILRILS